MMRCNLEIVETSNLSKPDAKYWELQNKLKFIKIGSQKAEIALIALSIKKFLLYYIIKRSHQVTTIKWEWKMMRKWKSIKY